jgi:Ser/Thr protein kinase RdoA (MazF antagonist)
MRHNRLMERGWERAFPFVELSAGQMELLVGRAMPGARVVAAQPLTSGLRNTNYRIELAGGARLLLRLYVADPEACAREAGLLAAMTGRVAVPRLLYSDARATPPFALLEWLEGQALDEVLAGTDEPTARELAAVCGAALAAIHRTRFLAPGFLGPQMRVVAPMPAWAPTVLETLAGRVVERLGPELAGRVRQAVESNAGAVEPVWSEAVLVHADYKPWNLLVRRAASTEADVDAEREAEREPESAAAVPWQVAGILDWEFACAGCKLIDFATFLRGEAELPAGFGDAFASAYLAAGGSLPPGWRRLTRLVDLLNLMQLLAWADDRAADGLCRLVQKSIESV